MSEITFNSIYDGVSLALHAAFPDAQVHGGEVKQGLTPGDFNVIMPSMPHSKKVGQRWRRTPLLDVIYYPKSNYTAECYDAAHQLTQVLADITTPEGDVIHASTCECTVTDGVLHVSLQYPHCVYIPNEQDVMETLQIKTEG